MENLRKWYRADPPETSTSGGFEAHNLKVASSNLAPQSDFSRKTADYVFKLFNGVLARAKLKFDREGHRHTAYSLRHTYICMRLMEEADIYQIAKNCRTSVEMAINGVFRTGISPLPVLPLAILLPVIIGAPLLL
jgi:hypothetical protein